MPLRENVTPEYAEALYGSILRETPGNVLEIGMAFGVTSLAILTALEEIGGGGELTTIDPYQSTDWHGIGVLNVERARLDHAHTLIEDYDYLALPRLLEAGARF